MIHSASVHELDQRLVQTPSTALAAANPASADEAVATQPSATLASAVRGAGEVLGISPGAISCTSSHTARAR